MAVDHHGFASLAELFAIVRTALRQHPHLVKDARASPVRGCSDFAHTAMFERPRVTVNCPNGQVFPIRNLEAARSAPSLLSQTCIPVDDDGDGRRQFLRRGGDDDEALAVNTGIVTGEKGLRVGLKERMSHIYS